MTTSPKYLDRIDRREWYPSALDRVLTTAKHEDDKINYEWAANLGSGEYIWGVSWDPSGPTLTEKTSATVASLAAALAAGSASGTYYYRVAVLDADSNEVAWSDEVTASPSSEDVTLTWDAWAGTPALGSYRVWKGTSSGIYTEYFSVTAGTETYVDDDTAGTAGTPAGPVNYSATVTKTGTAKATISTSKNRTIVREFRWRATGGSDRSDYGR